MATKKKIELKEPKKETNLKTSTKGSTSNLSRDDFDAGPSSYDKIEDNLYLSNLTSATDVKWLKKNNITHILTVDSCPLPRKIQEIPELSLKYIQITDMPREDILTYFEDSYQFIDHAIKSNGTVLVHCYFGMSRSATLVIAYVMKKYELPFIDAFEIVKKKRKFVGPNPGFLAQLKLYEDMGWTIDSRNIQFKLYRLQIAADKVRKAKILPSSYVDLIKPDPARETVRPEPTVYRCAKCRRIVASASNILPHLPHERQIWRHISTKRTEKNEKKTNNDIIVKTIDNDDVKNDKPEYCNKIYFIEPLGWMPDVLNHVEGKLNCPKCQGKLGAFSWISGCQCPCGTKIAPAFYLIPSKVDWSNAVQNVLVTV